MKMTDKAKIIKLRRELRELRMSKVERFTNLLDEVAYDVWVAETKKKIDRINRSIRATNT